jgi:alginate O-acetyltransferase complex protein AlgI
MSYTIEVYRKRMEPCRSLFDFAVYVSFFPQLVAGPIERATNLIREVVTPRVITADKIGMGLSLILLGYFKKVVMADNLSPTVDAIFNKPGPYTGEEVVIGVVFFAFQIYGDFSGYTDIARGIARLMGFELITNFREPYFARSPSDFWHRWHISLSSWLRDYLYIPLGGNRGARWKTYRNLMLTMILGGLWHGARWNFVLWGLFHGTLLVAYKAYEDIRRPDTSNITKTAPWHAVVSTAIMFLLTLYSWLLFRANSAAQIVDLTLALGRFTSVKPLLAQGVKLVFYVWPIVLLDYLKFRSNDDEPILTRAPIGVQSACYAVLMLMFVVFGRYEGASFIYFQF